MIATPEAPMLTREQVHALLPYFAGYVHVTLAAVDGLTFAIFHMSSASDPRIWCMSWDTVARAWAVYQGPYVRWLKTLLPEDK